MLKFCHQRPFFGIYYLAQRMGKLSGCTARKYPLCYPQRYLFVQCLVSGTTLDGLGTLTMLYVLILDSIVEANAQVWSSEQIEDLLMEQTM